MKLIQVADLIHRWFDEAKQMNGPILPDGWFGGRPGENIYLLECVEVVDGTLVIHLSEDTTLSLTNPARTFVANSELVFEDFDRAIMRWREYGGTEYRELQYDSGQVRLVPPIGRIISMT